MEDALFVHRLQFAFTVTYHYLYPQLTMGLTLLVLILKTKALRAPGGLCDQCARFWIKVLAVTFVLGVVTGIPLEFQFGTNWARFSKLTGGVIGHTLAMEAIFSFFLESSFVGLLLFGEKRLGPRGHWFAALMVCLGAWLSGYLIIATNAWMQHPVGFTRGPDGVFHLESFWALILNKWAFWQYAHNMSGSVITASFFMSAIGAFYLLADRHHHHAREFLRLGIIAGVTASAFQLFPTGDFHGKMVAEHQPVTLAAMEGLFKSQEGAPVAIIGQPDMEKQRLDNPMVIPRLLSFLTFRHWTAEVKGLDAFPREDWPENIPLLYYAYHIMVGLGTIFIAILAAASWLLSRGKLWRARGMLWVLMLSLPFPFIANTAGWITAEMGRQPWLVYGLVRTRDGASPLVSAGSGWFTLIGFMGMYTVLTFLFLFLVGHVVGQGPSADPEESPAGAH